jgi:GR25 family glycosyltransferase involved in LPS biosynthesis
MLLSLPSETEVIWDTDHNPCHTLQRVVDSDEPILIMEDDIELCKDFFNKAKAEIDKRPKVFTMFYSCNNGEKEEAENKKKGIPYDRPYVYTQAYYLPA